ncbi:WRKY transcription factor [Quillaja saponaria]|uniref:WRKY transcription factor n=1 Tax=Quillaja saponaria TaxID=32244 RepID=A0AAD7Q099_QUISA|nr:WRKY transcription factor [Quillaja saponaria]
MDIKEAERVVVAKPVASRPACSTFRSFSELLAGAIDASPHNESSVTAVAAIRPKTVRVKPMVNRASAGQAEISGVAPCSSSDNILKTDTKGSVLYKPLAKFVSKTTVSLLANMGTFNTSQQQPQHSIEAIQHPNQEKHIFRTDLSSSLHKNNSSCADTDQTTDPSKMALHSMEEDPKSLPPTSNGDRPSYDGYNWRKYGQKQVKGSEYPRSYYKCTHPNCPVKKKVERSLDGQIAEIVYKGEHNHSKPQTPKRNSSGTQGAGFVFDGIGEDTSNRQQRNHLSERNVGSEGREGNRNDTGLFMPLTSQGKASLPNNPVPTGAVNASGGSPENSHVLSGECEEGSRGLEVEEDEPRGKRRKNENQSIEAGISGEGLLEPRIVVQSSTDSEILGDGFRWRKYGQKVVKGNSYPRSYYRCTNINCNVRKHVERTSDDPRAFITTYEGKHNHEMPLKNTSSVASETDLKAPMGRAKP